MFIAVASIEYDSKALIFPKDSVEPTPLQIAFKERFPNWSTWSENIIDNTDAAWLSDHGIKYTIGKMKGLMDFNYPGSSSVGPTQTVHVHVPNIGLFAIDEVIWMENACTQDLQGMLDEGWRILAVCPPNSQRRPDYILGRSKK